MATRITLAVDDQSARGMQSYSRNAAVATQQTQGLAAATNSASIAQSGAMKSSNAFSRGILEASRGVEDFSVQLGPMGLGGALRASANNVSQMAFVMGGPLAGAVAGVGIAIGSLLIPRLFEQKSETGELNRELEDYIDNLGRLKDAATFTTRTSAIETREAASRQLDNELKKLKEINAQEEALRKTRKELFGAGTEEDKLPESEKKKLEELNKAIIEVAKNALGSIRRIAELREAVETLQPDPEIQKKADEERRSRIEKHLREMRQFSDQIEQMDRDVANRREIQQIQELEGISDINKEIEDTARERKKLTDELKRENALSRLSNDERKRGLEEISRLHEKEDALIRRKVQLESELGREAKRQADIRKRENDRRLQEEIKYSQDAIKLASDKFDAEVDLLKKKLLTEKQLREGVTAPSGAQQIAQAIPQGQLVREIARQRVEETGTAVTPREIEIAIRKEVRKVRGELAVAGRTAKGVATGDLKASEANIQKINRVQQEVQRAQQQLIKRSVGQAQAQGQLGKATAEALLQASETLAEQSKEQADQSQRIQQIESFIKATKEGSRRRQSQRRGTRG